MAKAAKLTAEEATQRRAYWSKEIEASNKRYRNFVTDGDRVIDEYRSQKEDGSSRYNRDKYAILYSTTETIRPNLYGKLPTVRVLLRNKDTASQAARDGVMLLQSNLQYIIEAEDFDDLMECVVEDVLLPGMGQGWVRYEPTFEPIPADSSPAPAESGAKKVANDETGEKLVDEQVRLEYVYWADFRTGQARNWKTVPWVARRCYMTKEAATRRFGEAKASKMTYAAREVRGKDDTCVEDTAEIWEIWDRRQKAVFWFAESYPEDLLDTKKDPLRLKDFFPCPRPVRAVYNTRSFIPLSLYSQYKAQAEQINDLTKRIRLLSQALKVAGLYDGSQTKLSDLLNADSGNKMIPIEGWAAFKGDGGVKGSIEWLPLTDVVNALTQLLAAREVCKAEIYEITGFSDILRGVSKASETLGAQNIKANWGGARLKRMQKEIQRFARDMIAIAGEIICEHCRPATIALFGGIEMPTDAVSGDPNAQAIIKRFMDAVTLLRNEGRRLSAVDIETDSTILADETAERADRMQFLSSAGAFLQQAVPAMEATPEIAPLLAAMLMFTVRTFPSSRPIEDAFEQVTRAMESRKPKPPEGNGDAGKIQTAQIQAQTEQVRIQAETGTAQAELQAKAQYDAAKLDLERTAEANRHAERMAELGIKQRETEIRAEEVAVKRGELAVKEQGQELDEQVAAHDADLDNRQLDLDFERVENEAARTEEEALTPEGE